MFNILIILILIMVIHKPIPQHEIDNIPWIIGVAMTPMTPPGYCTAWINETLTTPCPDF